MKKMLAVLIVITVLFTTSALAERIDITAENFEQYFSVSVDTGKSKTKSGYLGATYDVSADVTLMIDAKTPFKIYDVSFDIKAVGGLASQGHVLKYENIQFNGIIPQNGSYSDTQPVTINSFIGDSLKYNYFTIENADGYIEIGDASDSNDTKTDSVADELLKLGELLEKGLITQEEFDTQKAKLLGN